MSKIIRDVRKAGTYVRIYQPTSEGFTPRQAKKWMKKVQKNRRTSPASAAEKEWAYDHGFMPETVARFGVNEQNAGDFVSERDYYYLYPLNGQYIKWLSDKITVHEIFKPFDAWMPEYYYQIGKRDGETFLIQLRHLDAAEYGHDIRSMLRLIRAKGLLELADAKRNRSVLVGWDGARYFFAPVYAPNDRTPLREDTLVKRICVYSRISVLREYLKPAEGFRSKEGQPYTLRIAIFNEMGDNPELGRAVLDMQEPLTEEQVRGVSQDGGPAEFLVSYDPGRVFPKPRSEEEDGEEDAGEEKGNDDSLNDAEADAGESGDAAEPVRLERDIDRYDPRYYEIHLRMLSSVDRDSGVFRGALTVHEGERVQITKDPVTGAEILGEIPKWAELQEMIDRLCRFVPELELFGAVFVITEAGPKILRFQNMPSYPVLEPFGPEITRYLKRKIREKKEAYEDPAARRERGHHKAKLKLRKMFARTFYPKGLKPYLSVTWIHDVLFDLFQDKSVPVPEKIWGYRHGFFSYRLPQYGITKDNWEDTISDLEYKWMRHINSRYRGWLEDKITVKYICSRYNEFFPAYYYYTMKRNGINKIIPMMDCPEDYGNTFDDVFRLVREKGELALKPVSGSHGDGFYRFSYENGVYCLNREEVTKEQVVSILANVDNQYLITEYIRSCKQLRDIYDGSVNTLRLEVFKKDGRTPEIHDCYMRIGTSRTGAVDNIGAGGMNVLLDAKDGHYHDAALMIDNNIVPTPRHPDTGVLIDGYIPHWDLIVDTVKKVAMEIPQLEWMGFDVAVTEDGLKFPEINRYPDYPRMNRLSQETMDYLLYKLQKKKEAYGYDEKRPATLITLPDRKNIPTPDCRDPYLKELSKRTRK